MRRPIVAGNWKMNTTRESAAQLAQALAAQFSRRNDSVQIILCPPFPYLTIVGSVIAGTRLELGAQNAYHESPGAFTGEVALEMLLDVGCRWVILGHSERRHVLGETNELLNRKVTAALHKGLRVIYCVGELLNEREAGQTEAVLETQMQQGLAGVPAAATESLVVAYEPVWAIGTGVTATVEQAESAHSHLRNWIEARYNSAVAQSTRILYGGSVKPDNALNLMQQDNVDGALVGGASLKSELFAPIVDAAFTLAG